MSKSRVAILDVLRGIAILLVLGRHFLFLPEELPSFLRVILTMWRDVGWIGVDLFFVLSGFLVSSLLFREYSDLGGLNIRRFLIRRAFKLYPSFYFFFVVTLVTSAVFSIPHALSFRECIGEALFIQNYLASIWNHTWSLAVEEHFYLLLCFVLFCLLSIRSTKDSPFGFLPVFIWVVLFSILLLRVVVAQVGPVGAWDQVLPYTHFRIDSLFFGVLIAFYHEFHREYFLKQAMKFNALLFVCGLGVVPLPWLFPLEESRFMYSFGFTILYVGFGCLLTACLVRYGRKQFQLPIRAIQWIGVHSYSIYLWHMMAYWVMREVSDTETLTNFYIQSGCYLIGSILLGVFSAKIVEFPMLRIRDRFFPSRTPSLLRK